MNRRLKLINNIQLEDMGACSIGREWFSNRYPEGETTLVNLFSQLRAERRYPDALWLVCQVVDRESEEWEEFLRSVSIELKKLYPYEDVFSQMSVSALPSYLSYSILERIKDEVLAWAISECIQVLNSRSRYATLYCIHIREKELGFTPTHYEKLLNMCVEFLSECGALEEEVCNEMYEL